MSLLLKQYVIDNQAKQGVVINKQKHLKISILAQLGEVCKSL